MEFHCDGQALLEPRRRRGLFAGAAGVALLAGGGWWLLAGVERLRDANGNRTLRWRATRYIGRVGP